MNSTSTPPSVPPSPTPGVTNIKHIVIIFDENVSFDHYFATYPTAANASGEPPFSAASGTPTPDGLSGSLLTANPNAANTKNGAGATNPFRLDRAQAYTADQDHQYTPEQIAFDNGAMDLFPLSVGAADSATLARTTGAKAVAATSGLTMGYYDGNTVTAMWNYAQHYALNDHFFGTTFGPSTVGAINLVSGQTNGVVAGQNAGSVIIGDGSGGYTLVGDADPEGDVCATTTGATASMTGKNIGDLLTAANVSWGWFQGGFDLDATNPNGTTGCPRSTVSPVTGVKQVDYIADHEPFQYYASTSNPQHTRPTSAAAVGTNADAANHQYDITDFSAALAAGNMPAVSFLKPPGYQDGHAGYSDPLDEQKFVVDMVNAIGQSQFWSSTAIIIAYDDSDGWYDHVINIVNGSATAKDALTGTGQCGSTTETSANALPGVSSSTAHAQGRCGYGPRLPLLVISPWANSNYVDSTVTDQSSIDHFIEDVFLGSQRIGNGSFDSISGTLDNMFNFSQSTPPNASVLVLDDSTGEVTGGS
jgi:phospholipase C